MGYLNAVYLGANYYATNSSDNYIATGFASRYQQTSGQHQWLIAPSWNGTGSPNITFTQAMTLDASGNLGIGATSSLKKLTVQGSTSDRTVEVIDNGSNDAAIMLQLSNVQEFTLGVDRTDNSFKISDSGALGTNDRLVIDSSGNLLVGTTTLTQAGSKMQVNGGVAGNQTFVFINTQTSGDAYGIQQVLSYTPNNGTSRFMTCGDSTADRIRLLSNGGIANYQANDTNLSDLREKTNFAPAKSYLDVICAIPVQTFNYIDQNLEEDNGLTLGVVAQDVQAVAPELVMESNWGTKDEPKMRLSIYQTDLQYALMKCIQEQQAIIESLKARLDAANL
jgi:hypothetical protein